MAEISIGPAVGSGFQLIARKPLTVMVWGAVRVLFLAAVLALYAPVLLGLVADVAKARVDAGGQAPPAEVAQIMSHLFLLQGGGFLFQIAGLFVGAVTFCAVTRAILYPERSALAYLRLGPPEFFFAVIAFAAGFVLAFGMLICMIPFVIAVAILATQHLWVAMAVVVGLGVLVFFAALIYVLLRFAFVVPMMVDDGQFHLFDAWTLTGGRTASLFVIGLCLAGIGIAAELVIGAVVFALGAAALGVAVGGIENLRSLSDLGAGVLAARLAPWLIVYAVAAIPLSGCATAIFYAPWARAYRDVAPPAEGAPAVPPTTPPPEPSPAVA